MTPMVVIYHSGFGHTEQVALCVVNGANRVAGVQAQAMSVVDVDWEVLAAAEAIVFGAPVYMGSVSATFKQFMDDSSRTWFAQGWQDKVAAGFVNSGAL
ncbi:MAG: NAD(P)H-dependent oxidoreductase, partial [Paraperlucidibaca sp.]|nr:NAD(P)H-dependent oxidoreductase [Paraperlucidibaca sp.]